MNSKDCLHWLACSLLKSASAVLVGVVSCGAAKITNLVVPYSSSCVFRYRKYF